MLLPYTLALIISVCVPQLRSYFVCTLVGVPSPSPRPLLSCALLLLVVLAVALAALGVA